MCGMSTDLPRPGPADTGRWPCGEGEAVIDGKVVKLRSVRIFGGMDGATLFDVDDPSVVALGATKAEGLVVWMREGS